MLTKKNFKLLGIGIILIIIQSFLQQYDMFTKIYSQYVGYLIPVIYAFFITIFLEPIVSLVEKKFKLKRVLAVVSLVVLIEILVIVPQVGKSIEELYGKLPFMQEQIEKYVSLSINFLKDENIITIGEAEIHENIKCKY